MQKILTLLFLWFCAQLNARDCPGWHSISIPSDQFNDLRAEYCPAPETSEEELFPNSIFVYDGERFLFSDSTGLILDETGEFTISPDWESLLLEYRDFNFDGINDLAVNIGPWGFRGRPLYHIYLYKDGGLKDKGFYFHKGLSEIIAKHGQILQVDTTKKELIGIEQSGYYYRGFFRYHWRGAQAVLFHSSQTYMENYIESTTDIFHKANHSDTSLSKFIFMEEESSNYPELLLIQQSSNKKIYLDSFYGLLISNSRDSILKISPPDSLHYFEKHIRYINEEEKIEVPPGEGSKEIFLCTPDSLCLIQYEDKYLEWNDVGMDHKQKTIYKAKDFDLGKWKNHTESK
jgi:hypothetical protein